MAISDADLLRARLGESIPEGGSDADTLFTDEQIEDFLDRYGSVANSLAEAWEVKAAALSTLVDTAEGNSRRQLSQAYANAIKQAAALAGGPGRARVHQIERPGFFA
jgi:hypothetical protein